MMDTSWLARKEGDEPWITRFPKTHVVRDRLQWIEEHVRDRRVAHIGFADVGCEASNSHPNDWLHARLATVAEVVGIDVSEAAVHDARVRGYEAVAVDCTDPMRILELGLAPFDVVLLGEVIEHVDNPGGLLRTARILLGSGGELIVTTPNARRLTDLAWALAGREVIHPDHVALHSIRTLISLLARHGFACTEYTTYLNRRPRRPRTLREVILRAPTMVQRVLALTVAPYVADGLIIVADVSP